MLVEHRHTLLERTTEVKISGSYFDSCCKLKLPVFVILKKVKFVKSLKVLCKFQRVVVWNEKRKFSSPCTPKLNEDHWKKSSNLVP